MPSGSVVFNTAVGAARDHNIMMYIPAGPKKALHLTSFSILGNCWSNDRGNRSDLTPTSLRCQLLLWRQPRGFHNSAGYIICVKLDDFNVKCLRIEEYNFARISKAWDRKKSYKLSRWTFDSASVETGLITNKVDMRAFR